MTIRLTLDYNWWYTFMHSTLALLFFSIKEYRFEWAYILVYEIITLNTIFGITEKIEENTNGK